MVPGRQGTQRWIIVLRHAFFMCCAIAGLACGAPAAAQPPAHPWRVVLIRSWDSLYPINTVREAALREALAENSPRVVEFYPEEIDLLRFPEAVEPALISMLQSKYRDTPVDLVIASGMEPLDFASRHRDEIWPGAAIVFNSVFEGTMDGWTRPPRTTGLTLDLDVDGAIALGLALVPAARRVYVVSGAAPSDRLLLDLTRRKLAHLDSRLEANYIVGLTQAETSIRVASLERDSFVLYLTTLRDGAGKLSGPDVPAMRMITSHSKVPVVSVIHTQFGRGVVGGSSPRYDVHGQAAGALARRVLDGADPDLIPIKADPAPVCEVDWNGLRRWALSERDVPSACAVVNRPPNLWNAYFWPMVAILLVLFLQAALIWSLAMQSRRRHVAEAQLLARTAEMAQVSRLSMIGALTASIAHEINQPMGAILSNAEAAEMMLEQGTLEPDKLREILADIRNEDLRASEVIRSLRKLLARSEWKPSALEPNAEVAEALSHVAFEAARRNVRLTPVFGKDMPAVMGDSVQLQQVVINLVVNAIEAVSGVPGARREARVETRARGEGIEIAVSDEGPGLSEEDAGRLFESNFTTKKEGMGFGLAIVRTIVEMHRGRVWFEPNVPHGAVFRVWIPAIGA
ncbi:MAG: sensor histidine kinase [Usitatibacter sp.]